MDASAIGAVVFYEPAGETIAPRLEGHALVAPHLLSLELANICLKKMRREPARTAEWVAGFNLWLAYGIQERSVDPVAVFALARSSGLTAYDASYLWLARTLGAELVTLDRQLERAAV